MESHPSAEEQLRNVERARLRALVDGDIELAAVMHTAEFQLINPAGESFSKAAYLDMIASGDLRYVMWEPEEIAVRMNDDRAAIRYRSMIQGNRAGEPFEGRYWHTDTYERRDGQWQVVWSQATEISAE